MLPILLSLIPTDVIELQMNLTELWGSIYYTVGHRFQSLAFLVHWWLGCRRKAGTNAGGGEESASEARDRWFKVTVTVEVNIKVTAVMPVYFTPWTHPWLCPSFHPRWRGWNVTKLNCSQPLFAASDRHCLGLLSSFQSLSLFSSQAVLSKSPFGCAKVCACVCMCVCVCVCVCVCWSISLFLKEFSDAHWPRASQIQGLWGCLTVAIYPDLGMGR